MQILTPETLAAFLDSILLEEVQVTKVRGGGKRRARYKESCCIFKGIRGYGDSGSCQSDVLRRDDHAERDVVREPSSHVRPLWPPSRIPQPHLLLNVVLGHHGLERRREQ